MATKSQPSFFKPMSTSDVFKAHPPKTPAVKQLLGQMLNRAKHVKTKAGNPAPVRVSYLAKDGRVTLRLIPGTSKIKSVMVSGYCRSKDRPVFMTAKVPFAGGVPYYGVYTTNDNGCNRRNKPYAGRGRNAEPAKPKAKGTVKKAGVKAKGKKVSFSRKPAGFAKGQQVRYDGNTWKVAGSKGDVLTLTRKGYPPRRVKAANVTKAQ